MDLQIDKRMEDYFRMHVGQGMNHHMLQVAITPDNKIALRMMPIPVPPGTNIFADLEKIGQLKQQQSIKQEEARMSVEDPLVQEKVPLIPIIERIQKKIDSMGDHPPEPVTEDSWRIKPTFSETRNQEVHTLPAIDNGYVSILTQMGNPESVNE